MNTLKRLNDKFVNFLWLTIPGTIILIIIFSLNIYQFWEKSGFMVIVWSIGDLLAISNFIHLSSKHKD